MSRPGEQRISFWITVLQPDECSADVCWNVLHIVNNNWLFAPGRHENFCCFVVIAKAALVERALDALVCCVLSNPYGFRKFR